jgi:hypothetical protein
VLKDTWYDRLNRLLVVLTTFVTKISWSRDITDMKKGFVIKVLGAIGRREVPDANFYSGPLGAAFGV